MKIVKEAAKQFLFIDNMVLYIENYQYNDSILKTIRHEKGVQQVCKMYN